MLKRVHIRRHERGLVFVQGELDGVLGPGKHAIWGLNHRVEVVNITVPRLEHPELDALTHSGRLGAHAEVVVVSAHERAVIWRDGALVDTLGPGRHIVWLGWGETCVDLLDMRMVVLVHGRADSLLRSGALADVLSHIELEDHEAALVWRNGRIAQVLGAGSWGVWTGLDRVHVERYDRRDGRLRSSNLGAVVENDRHGETLLHAWLVADGYVGALYKDGELHELLDPGYHVFWRGPHQWNLSQVAVRERVSDVSGQDIITHDKVTLRLNAVVTWQVVDVRKALQTVVDVEAALYREAQLALRAVIGTRDLEPLLEERTAVTTELLDAVRGRTEQFGVRIQGLGIRDIILPGDMRELLNRVTEARTAAEASVITRREETAAMRSQANTARLFEQNPTLMRLKELEVMERIADGATLNIFSGEAGVQERLLKLI